VGDEEDEAWKSLRRAAIGIAVTLSVSCVSSEEVAKAQLRYEATIPTCRSDRECELKWSAARTWVLGHSTMKIQTLTSDFMETFNPTNDVDFTYRVTKEPNVAAAGYRILAFVYCHKHPSSCSKARNPWLEAIDFNATVNGAVPR
jgi:hypothetical protein